VDYETSLHIALGFHGLLLSFVDGFLVVLQCATSVDLYGPSSRLHIGLGFHGVLLSLLSNAKDGPKRGRVRKGLFEAWKYLKRKDVVSGRAIGRRAGSNLPLTQRLIAARPKANSRGHGQLTRYPR
jgi:hypothetical protein